MCLSIGATIGSDCEDVSGFWQNQLGSNMTIKLTPENYITGEYSTAVESKKSAALISSNITGIYKPVDNGALLSFSVLFNHGKSLTTWVGQCMVCAGEEILFTSWVLRNHYSKSVDRWMSNNINQDVFKRVRDGSNSIPRHLKMAGPSEKDERSTSCEKNIKASSNGHWVSDTGDVLRFDSCYESGLFTGLHYTTQNNNLFGRTAGGPHFTALGFVSTSSNEVKGWTGHIYESLSERERKIETSWLIHAFSDNCKNPTNFLRFGNNNYSFTTNYKEKKAEDESIAKQIYNYFWSFF